MNNYFDHNEDFSKAFRILDERYIGVWSFIGGPSPSPLPVPSPVASPSGTPSAFVPDQSVLPSSGAISLDQVQDAFGGSNPISISEYYSAASGIPASGTIRISDFYGKFGVLPPVSLGYFIGGRQSPYAGSRYFQRIQFSNDTLSIRPAQLSQGRELADVVENTTYGYVCGGSTGHPGLGFTDEIERYQFSNETVSNPPVDLPQSIYLGRGVSSDTKGFYCGGYNVNPSVSPATTILDVINEINLSNGTLSIPPTTLTRVTQGAAKLNTKGAGYLVHGSADPANNIPNVEPSVSKLRFSDTTVSTIFATALLGNPSNADSFTNRSGGKGYLFGGFAGSPEYNTGSPLFYTVNVERIVYSTDTFSILPTSNEVWGRSNVGLFSDSTGYIAGGFNQNPAAASRFSKFAFSSETFTTSTPTFSTCFQEMCSTQI